MRFLHSGISKNEDDALAGDGNCSGQRADGANASTGEERLLAWELRESERRLQQELIEADQRFAYELQKKLYREEQEQEELQQNAVAQCPAFRSDSSSASFEIPKAKRPRKLQRKRSLEQEAADLLEGAQNGSGFLIESAFYLTQGRRTRTGKRISVSDDSDDSASAPDDSDLEGKRAHWEQCAEREAQTAKRTREPPERRSLLTEAEVQSRRQARLDEVVRQTELCEQNLKDKLAVLGTPNKRTAATVDDEKSFRFGGGGGLILKPYQRVGVLWLFSLHQQGINGILADEMGLGKTLQTLCFLSSLKKNSADCKPHLIVAPLSVVSHWKSEIERFFPEMSVYAHIGKAADRFSLWETGDARVDVVATSYELVVSDFCGKSRSRSHRVESEFVEARRVLRKLKFEYLVVDEAHRLKNSRSMLFEQLSMNIKAERRLLLTGTPLQNDLCELWSLLNFCLPDIFDSSASFEKWFSQPFGQGSSLTLEGKKVEPQGLSDFEQRLIIERLHRVLRPFLLRRTKEEVLSNKAQTSANDLSKSAAPATLEQGFASHERGCLTCQRSSCSKPMCRLETGESESPNSEVLEKRNLTARTEGPVSLFPRQETTVFCPLSRLQDILQGYTRLQKVYEVNSSNPLMALRKIALHPFLLSPSLFEDQDVEQCWNGIAAASGKFLFLAIAIPLLLKKGHRLLLFSQFKSALDFVETLLELLDIKLFRLDGSTSQESRELLIDCFNQPPESQSTDRADVFLLSTRAGGLGVNLQSADTVILLDPDLNPQQDLQAIARCHRLGQTQKVLVLRLISVGTIEEKIHRRCQEKLHTERAAIAAGKFDGVSSRQERQLVLNELLDNATAGSSEKSSSHDESLRWMHDCTALCSLLSRSVDEAEAYEALADKDLLGSCSSAFRSHEPVKWISRMQQMLESHEALDRASVKDVLQMGARALKQAEPSAALGLIHGVTSPIGAENQNRSRSLADAVEAEGTNSDDEDQRVSRKRASSAKQSGTSREASRAQRRATSKGEPSVIVLDEDGTGVDTKRAESLNAMVEMGFGRDQAITALEEAGGDMEQALESIIILEGGEEDVDETSESFCASVASLVEMGYSDQQARLALQRTCGDLEQAAELLIS